MDDNTAYIVGLWCGLIQAKDQTVSSVSVVIASPPFLAEVMWGIPRGGKRIGRSIAGREGKSIFGICMYYCDLDSKEVKPVHPKGNQLWILIARTDAETKAFPILCPPDVNSLLIGKDPDARKDWGQEEKGTTEDKVVGRHHQLSGHEFEQTQGDSGGQGSLACYSPWSHIELDMTEWLNNNNCENKHYCLYNVRAAL